MSQIFIPTLKQVYSVENRPVVQMYPMGDGLNYENELFETYSLYGNYKNGNLNFKYKRSVVKYDHKTMEDAWRNNKFRGFFFIATESTEMLAAIRHVNYPAQAMLIKDAEIYVEHSTYINTENKSYDVMAEHGITSERIPHFSLDKKVYPSIEIVNEALEAENEAHTRQNNLIFEKTLKAGADFSKIIEGSVPVNYAIETGSKIKIVDLGAKKPPFSTRTKVKAPFAHLEINGKKLWIPVAELTKFEIK